MENLEKLISLARTSKKESRQLDFKSEFDPNSPSDWCEILKDIIAFSNSGGGVILFGVTDDGGLSNFDKNIVLNIDPAVVSDKIRSYTGENFSDFEITEIKHGSQLVAAMVISSAPSPIVFTRNGGDVIVKGKQKPAFLKGTVYFRHGAKSEPGETSDIRIAIERLVKRTRKTWFEGVRQISQVRVGDEVLVTRSKAKSVNNEFTVARLLKISQQGKPVKLTHAEFEALKKEYPLEYKDVLIKCKKKKAVTQKQLQKYIDSCKKDQNLSINWRTVGRSLNLPFSVPDKYMYQEEVVDRF